MRKSRILYGMILLIEMGLLFWSGSGLLLGLLTAQFLILVLLWIALRLDTEKLKLSLRMPSACLAGRELLLTLEIDKKVFLAAGVMEAVLACENHMMNMKNELPVRVIFAGKKHMVQIPFQTDSCGQSQIQLKQIRCYDIFGLMERDIPMLDEQSMVVYPRETALQLSLENLLSGGWEGEQRTLDRCGRDTSEVFELREYQPGDDVRRIHWKLSGKMGKMLIRQASDTFRCDTYVLLDTGHMDETRNYPITQMAAAVSVAASVSQGLSELGISHYTGIAAGEHLLSSPVGESAEFQRMLNTWMTVRLAETKGKALSYFMLEQFQQHYNRLIYITNGMCPEAFFELPPELKITAVCILEDKEEASVRQQGNCTILEIPQGELWKTMYTIAI